MSIPESEADLRAALVELGTDAQAASVLAREQIEDGTPHLQTKCFLQILRSYLFETGNKTRFKYIDKLTPEELAANPFATAAKRILECGADPLDLAMLIRESNYHLLEKLFNLFDNNEWDLDLPAKEFGVYAMNESTNEPVVRLDALHELVDELRADR